MRVKYLPSDSKRAQDAVPLECACDPGISTITVNRNLNRGDFRSVLQIKFPALKSDFIMSKANKRGVLLSISVDEQIPSVLKKVLNRSALYLQNIKVILVIVDYRIMTIVSIRNAVHKYKG